MRDGYRDGLHNSYTQLPNAVEEEEDFRIDS